MTSKIYDVIVIGSGATGGMAAKELCEAGLSVAVLEAAGSLILKKISPNTPGLLTFHSAGSGNPV